MAQTLVPANKAGGAQADVVVIGYRNQYDSQLGEGSHVSCLRSSLSFLRLIFTHGIDFALTADSIDGVLVEGRAWTVAGSKSGEAPCMVSIVELPNKITYANSANALCCVFSRLYGDSGFYMHPGDGFQSTQIPARQFFDGVWKSRSESFALITIGAIGLAVYRHGDVAYVFDPHGHGSVTEAFVVRVLARDVYAYLTGYAATDPESDWAGALVFFVTCGPTESEPGFLISATSLLYGISETYLSDEQYVERSVATSHPGISTPPPLTDVAVGAVSEAWQYQELENGAATLDADMEGVAPAAAQVRASVIRQPTEKRVSLPKRRRPPWTPPTSSENLTTSGNTHTVAGRPSQKVRNATANVQNPTTGNGSAWAEALNDGGVDNASRPGQAVGAAGTLQNPAPGDALAMETTQASEEALRTRRVFRLSGEDEAPYDLGDAVGVLSAEINELATRAEELDVLSSTCVDSTVWVTRPHNSPDMDILEQFITMIFNRLLSFLVENGARTRTDSPSVIAGLFPGVLAAIPTQSAVVNLLQATGMALSDVASYKSILNMVSNEDSPVGELAVIKLELVASEVIKSTQKLVARVEELERDVTSGSVNPLGLYTYLTERLVAEMTKHGGDLFAREPKPGAVSLTERIGSLFRKARTREARATRTNASLARDLNAIEAAVHAAHDKFDAIEIKPADPSDTTNMDELAKSLDLSAVPTRVAKVIKKVESMVSDSIREYFLRGFNTVRGQ